MSTQQPHLLPLPPASPTPIVLPPELAIGRSHENSLQLLDNTISKKHAKIVLLNGLYYLRDLGSANGVFVNGIKIGKGDGQGEGKGVLEDGDTIQFGKYGVVYRFVDGRKGNAKNRGKINLKDYVFEDGLQKNKAAKNSNVQPLQGQQSVLTQPFQPATIQPQILKKKQKPKQSKIKIPDIADYLKLVEPSSASPELIDNETVPVPAHNKSLEKYTRPQKQQKLKLSSMQNQLPSQQQLKSYSLQKRQRNIFLQQQQTLRKLQIQRKKIQQQKLQKQLQQAKQAEDLLQKQLLLQQRIKQQTQKSQSHRQVLQQQFALKQQQSHEQQLAHIQSLQKQQQAVLQQLQAQHAQSLQSLQSQFQSLSAETESKYKNQYQQRKKQLEIEAEALARQYEKIYRQAIQKVRNQIEEEESTIGGLEEKERQLEEEGKLLEGQIGELGERIAKGRMGFLGISGRNRACVVYASHLQEKIDGIEGKEGKEEREGRVKGNGYYFGDRKSQAIRKLEDSILNSRKLLKIKVKQFEHLNSQIIALNASIKEKQYGSTTDVSDFLDTIYQNLQTIQTLKQQYLQLIQSQRNVQQIWQAQIQQNTELENKNRVLESDITRNIRQIDQNSRDQIKKSTQQRLHMLKSLHFSPQPKKTASKFLIEQMLALQQQIHKYRTGNEEMHRKIGKIISQTEKVKRENEYLSEILFSQDENGHHFDNMKIVINNLMDGIAGERGIDCVGDCVQLVRDMGRYELMIQSQLERKRSLKESMRKISQMGLAPPQIKQSQKIPLTFFGDLMTTKQIQIQQRKSTIASLQNDANSLKNQMRLLQQRKSKISETLQKYKMEQIGEARKYMGRN